MAIANRRVQSGWRSEPNTHGNGVAKPNGDSHSCCQCDSDSHGNRNRDGNRNSDAYPNSNDRAAADSNTPTSPNTTTSPVGLLALNG